jgi:sulfite reductase alpha subunit-like flavoprotein
VDSLDFSVLGFGDSSYANFCGFARRLNARLEHLGARRIVDRASCGRLRSHRAGMTDRVARR